jgi:hypothetical protein
MKMGTILMIQSLDGYRYKFAQNADGIFSWDTIQLLNLSNIFDYEFYIGSYAGVDYFGNKYYYYPLRILSDEFLRTYNPTFPAKDFLDDMWFLKYFIESFKKEIYDHY